MGQGTCADILLPQAVPADKYAKDARAQRVSRMPEKVIEESLFEFLRNSMAKLSTFTPPSLRGAFDGKRLGDLLS